MNQKPNRRQDCLHPPMDSFAVLIHPDFPSIIKWKKTLTFPSPNFRLSSLSSLGGVWISKQVIASAHVTCFPLLQSSAKPSSRNEQGHVRQVIRVMNFSRDRPQTMYAIYLNCSHAQQIQLGAISMRKSRVYPCFPWSVQQFDQISS